MSDLSNFRIVRSVQKCPSDSQTFFHPLTKAQSETDFVAEIRDSQKKGTRSPTQIAQNLLRSKDPDVSVRGDSATSSILLGLRELDDWLSKAADKPNVAELRLRLDALASGRSGPRSVGTEPWIKAKQRLVDLLMAATILSRHGSTSAQPSDQTIGSIELAATMSRRILVAGLKETAGEDTPTPDAVFHLLKDRTLVLSEDVLRILQTGTERESRRMELARRPGFADLYVVRSEWSCYVPGEIAHIENVMRGEEKERTHMRLDETEASQTEDVTKSTVDERDTQTTDRFALDSESARETNLKLEVEAAVDTSGQYGPTRVNTHVAGSFEYSVEESRRLATSHAQELVARAVSKVEHQIRQARTSRTLNRITETNFHKVSAIGASEHIVGVYHWVDKIERVQVFRYPHRYLLEFQLPEPAAYLVWARQQPSSQPSGRSPIPFTIDGTPTGRPLAVTDVTAITYAGLAARYGASDIPPVPPSQTTVQGSMILEAEPPKYEEAGTNNINLRSAPAMSKTAEIAIPDGYATLNVYAAASAAPALARWGDFESESTDVASDSHYLWRWGYHYPRVDVVIGDTLIKFQDTRRPTIQAGPTRFQNGWLDMTTQANQALRPASGKLTVAANAAGTYRAAVSFAITCAATQHLLDGWAADAYARIHSAYAEQQKAFDDASTAASVDPIANQLRKDESPELNKIIVQEELKRQIVELLLGSPFDDGFSAVNRPANGRPRLNRDEVAAAAPHVQFIEQAFEWENLSYVCYPYFWGAANTWLDVAARRSTDSEFMRFLRAGSVRVVLPTRLGFEGAVNTFLSYGVPWGGGPAPVPDNPLYLSIADEIRSLQRGPRDGEVVESWEVRLPTTLVWLDRNSNIPKVNGSRKFREPPDAICPR